MSETSHLPLTIHQYHYTVAPHDAISNYLFWIQNSLKEAGISGEIFTSKKIDLKEEAVRSFSKDKMWNCDLLLIHHSQGNPDLSELLKVEVPKALVYNNITPASFFRHDPYIAKLCKLGRKQLKRLQKECFMGFGTSEVNLSDLREAHFSRVEKLPLLEISEKPVVEKKVFSSQTPTHLLFVGRLARHKNQALLIKTFFHLKNRLPEGSTLTLIGKGDPVYTEYLKLLIKQLNLSKQVFLKGKVSLQELNSSYNNSTAFISASLHEGFCIPLVEAMKYALPIFAIASEGVAETLGNAGLQIHTDNPREIAEILYNALLDTAALQSLSQSSTERLLPLSLFHSSNNLVEKLVSLVKNLNAAPPHQKAGMHAGR